MVSLLSSSLCLLVVFIRARLTMFRGYPFFINALSRCCFSSASECITVDADPFCSVCQTSDGSFFHGWVVVRSMMDIAICMGPFSVH